MYILEVDEGLGKNSGLRVGGLDRRGGRGGALTPENMRLLFASGSQELALQVKSMPEGKFQLRNGT